MAPFCSAVLFVLLTMVIVYVIIVTEVWRNSKRKINSADRNGLKNKEFFNKKFLVLR